MARSAPASTARTSEGSCSGWWEVCAAEAVFDGAVQYVDLGVFGCHVVGDLSGAVGTVVVDNEDIDFGGCLAQALHYDRKVFFFIVCGNNGEYAHKSP